eukprot:1237763-Rhodomonas_salina.1
MLPNSRNDYITLAHILNIKEFPVQDKEQENKSTQHTILERDGALRGVDRVQRALVPDIAHHQ